MLSDEKNRKKPAGSRKPVENQDIQGSFRRLPKRTLNVPVRPTVRFARLLPGGSFVAAASPAPW
jgi:hypothetical protein